ncbi:MAG: polyphosphate polymerase domain-containing protein [Bacteroidales bacterium]|nr:polyphosphate polymerase domain-containing protein [Bacteroidales bacterium]
MPECPGPIAGRLEALPPISLGEMDSIRLMNRIDTKFMTEEKTLARILSDAFRCGYRALLADGVKLSPYNSLYYDTADLKMYLDHHNRRLVREKIRTRVYLSSGATFLEVKRKNNKGRTRKKRTRIAPELFWDFRGEKEAVDYLEGHSSYTAEGISPALETTFDRITLVNAALTERLTIDMNLRFRNLRTGRTADLGDGVIIELKQDGRGESDMKRILLSLRVKPVRISKYCIGTTLTDPDAKSNRFKVKVRAIRRIIHTKITTS